MAISPDLVSGTAAALERTTQSTQKISDIRRGNWLLSLEREQLSSQSRYQSPDMNASNPGSSNMADDKAASGLAVHAQQENAPAQTLSCQQKQVARPVGGGTASLSTSTVYQLQMEVKSGVAPLATESEVSKVYARPVLKDLPTLKLNDPTAMDLNSTTEIEMMTSNSAELAAVTNDDSNMAEAYTSRQIHLYSHAGKVQAWIRDVQLDDRRTAVVEAALRHDLRKNGWELVGLTINGKQTASLLQKSQQRFQGHSVVNAK